MSSREKLGDVVALWPTMTNVRINGEDGPGWYIPLSSQGVASSEAGENRTALPLISYEKLIKEKMSWGGL